LTVYIKMCFRGISVRFVLVNKMGLVLPCKAAACITKYTEEEIRQLAVNFYSDPR